MPIGQKFYKYFRLRKRFEYLKLLRRSKRTVGQHIIMDIAFGKNTFPKLGITVSSKWNKAIKRNRFKRMVREAFRLSCHLYPQNIQIHIRPAPDANSIKMQDIYREMIFLIKEHVADKKINSSYFVDEMDNIPLSIAEK